MEVSRRTFLGSAVAGLSTSAVAAQSQIKLILHADDLGFSHAANRACIEMLEKNAVSSGSIMMPCPWVPEIADFARAHPEKDLGLHLTLTSEWKTMKWGPVAPKDKVPSLLDPNGYMWRLVEEVAPRGTPAEVEIELRAQCELARKMGIQFTHVDTHMGTLYARPDYFQVFEKIGREYQVPILRVKPSEETRRSAPEATIKWLLAEQARFEKEGWFQLDSLLTDAAGGERDYEKRKAAYHKALKGLKPGVNMMILHPAVMEDELRAATGTAVQRDGDYRIFLEESTRQVIGEAGVQLVGWRDVAPKGKAA